MIHAPAKRNRTIAKQKIPKEKRIKTITINTYRFAKMKYARRSRNIHISRAIAHSKISKEEKGCELRNGHRRCLFRLRTT